MIIHQGELSKARIAFKEFYTTEKHAEHHPAIILIVSVLILDPRRHDHRSGDKSFFRALLPAARWIGKCYSVPHNMIFIASNRRILILILCRCCWSLCGLVIAQIRHHSRGGEMHQQDNLAPSPSAAGGTIGTPSSSSSSSVLTPTMMINDEVQFDYIPKAQDRRKLPQDSCLTNPNVCPACHSKKTCCMEQNYNIYTGNPNGVGCTSNSFEVLSVGFLEVFDSGAYKCNCNGGVLGTPTCGGATTDDCQGKALGTYIGGCTGNDDTVEVRFKANFNIKNTEYDVALYINTLGESAKDGTDGCVIQGLSQTDESGTEYSFVGDADNNDCMDAIAAGVLLNYPFPKLTLNCAYPNNDGLLVSSL